MLAVAFRGDEKEEKFESCNGRVQLEFLITKQFGVTSVCFVYIGFSLPEFPCGSISDQLFARMPTSDIPPGHVILSPSVLFESLPDFRPPLFLLAVSHVSTSPPRPTPSANGHPPSQFKPSPPWREWKSLRFTAKYGRFRVAEVVLSTQAKEAY